MCANNNWEVTPDFKYQAHIRSITFEKAKNVTTSVKENSPEIKLKNFCLLK